MSEAWRPVLRGPLARRARAIACAVGHELAAVELADVVPGLYLGHGGLVVLYDYLCSIAPRRQRAGWRRVRAHHLARAMASVRGAPPFSLHFGALGVAWLLDRSRSRGADPCVMVDRALAAYLRDPAADRPYHLTFGLAGTGVYALERGLPAGVLRNLVSALAATAESDDAGTTWTWRLEGKRHVNLGVLTGIPGVIGVLAAIGDRLRWSRGVRALFEASVRWLSAQRSRSARQPLFPARVRPRPRRILHQAAYFYGDVGTAGVFLAARQPLLAPLVAELLPRAAAVSGRVTALDDLTLCHGAAGVGHVWNRIAQRTGDAEHRELAVRWLAATCNVIDGGRAGRVRPWQAWCKRPGFVDGAAGVALVLAAACSRVEPRWDRVLLLSRPGG